MGKIIEFLLPQRKEQNIVDFFSAIDFQNEPLLKEDIRNAIVNDPDKFFLGSYDYYPDNTVEAKKRMPG